MRQAAAYPGHLACACLKIVADLNFVERNTRVPEPVSPAPALGRTARSWLLATNPHRRIITKATRTQKSYESGLATAAGFFARFQSAAGWIRNPSPDDLAFLPHGAVAADCSAAPGWHAAADWSAAALDAVHCAAVPDDTRCAARAGGSGYCGYHVQGWKNLPGAAYSSGRLVRWPRCSSPEA